MAVTVGLAFTNFIESTLCQDFMLLFSEKAGLVSLLQDMKFVHLLFEFHVFKC
jgi:hypothetical protein